MDRWIDLDLELYVMTARPPLYSAGAYQPMRFRSEHLGVGGLGWDAPTYRLEFPDER